MSILPSQMMITSRARRRLYPAAEGFQRYFRFSAFSAPSLAFHARLRRLPRAAFRTGFLFAQAFQEYFADSFMGGPFRQYRQRPRDARRSGAYHDDGKIFCIIRFTSTT